MHLNVYTGEGKPGSMVSVGEEHNRMALPVARDLRCFFMQDDCDEAWRPIRQRFRSQSYGVAGNYVAARSGARCEECHRCECEDSQVFTDCKGKHENSVRQKEGFPRSKVQSICRIAALRKNALDAVIF